MVSKQEKIIGSIFKTNALEMQKDKIEIINLMRKENFDLTDKIYIKCIKNWKMPMEIKNELELEKKKLSYIKELMRRMEEPDKKLVSRKNANGSKSYIVNIEPFMAIINSILIGLKPKRKITEKEIRNIIFELIVGTFEKSNKAKLIKFARE
jgi:hypothetical protein